MPCAAEGGRSGWWASEARPHPGWQRWASVLPILDDSGGLGRGPNRINLESLPGRRRSQPNLPPRQESHPPLRVGPDRRHWPSCPSGTCPGLRPLLEAEGIPEPSHADLRTPRQTGLCGSWNLVPLALLCRVTTPGRLLGPEHPSPVCCDEASTGPWHSGSWSRSMLQPQRLPPAPHTWAPRPPPPPPSLA